MGVVTFRFDEKLEEEINRIARSEGKTKTEVVREALGEYTARKRVQRSISMAEAMKDYIGAGRSKRTDLSSQTGKRIREILGEKKKAGRL